ncbi:MAG: hypothetical protein CM1200mP30_32940 [Pseudomonadota bacterium]|nr:MAG: hypothetical protein CM1200mP30_32940 [Pseudomonadota bacterium]
MSIIISFPGLRGNQEVFQNMQNVSMVNCFFCEPTHHNWKAKITQDRIFFMVVFFLKMAYRQPFDHPRVVLVPFIYAGMVIGEKDQWILWGTWMVFLIACLTDYWDGFIARHRGKATKIGKLFGSGRR